MSNDLKIEVDASEVLRAFDVLGDAASRLLFEAARESAESVADEARARMARQTHGTGQTAEAITIEQTDSGYRVYVGSMGSRPQNLPWWIDQGTKQMDARPFMSAAAQLEEGHYLRRVAEALDAAIEEASK